MPLSCLQKRTPFFLHSSTFWVTERVRGQVDPIITSPLLHLLSCAMGSLMRGDVTWDPMLGGQTLSPSVGGADWDPQVRKDKLVPGICVYCRQDVPLCLPSGTGLVRSTWLQVVGLSSQEMMTYQELSTDPCYQKTSIWWQQCLLQPCHVSPRCCVQVASILSTRLLHSRTRRASTGVTNEKG